MKKLFLILLLFASFIATAQNNSTVRGLQSINADSTTVRGLLRSDSIAGRPAGWLFFNKQKVPGLWQIGWWSPGAVIQWRNLTGSDSTDLTGASNGLTLSTNDVQLGGALIKNTTVNGAFNLSLTPTGTFTAGGSTAILQNNSSNLLRANGAGVTLSAADAGDDVTISAADDVTISAADAMTIDPTSSLTITSMAGVGTRFLQVNASGVVSAGAGGTGVTQAANGLYIDGDTVKLGTGGITETTTIQGPHDITITASGSNNDLTLSASGDVNVSAISNNLNLSSGNDVTVTGLTYAETAANITSSATASNIVEASAGDVTLSASDDIFLNATGDNSINGTVNTILGVTSSLESTFNNTVTVGSSGISIQTDDLGNDISINSQMGLVEVIGTATNIIASDTDIGISALGVGSDVTIGATDEITLQSNSVTIDDLAGAGSRMVIADASGVLGTSAIPTGSISGTLTAPRIPFASGTSTLTDDADMSFTGGNQFNVTNAVVATALTNSALTATRVHFSGTGGLFVDDPDLIFTTATNTLSGMRVAATTTATLPGINVGSVAGNPSTTVVGDLWYNTTTNQLNTKVGGTPANVGILNMPLVGMTATRIPFMTNTTTTAEDADLTFTGGNTLNVTGVAYNGTSIQQAAETVFTVGRSTGTATTVQLQSPNTIFGINSGSAGTFQDDTHTILNGTRQTTISNAGLNTFGATAATYTIQNNETVALVATANDITFTAADDMVSTLTTGNIFSIDVGTPVLNISESGGGSVSLSSGAAGMVVQSSTGNINISTGAGNVMLTPCASNCSLVIEDGANDSMGVATLVGGTVVVNNAKVTANSRIFLTTQSVGGTAGFLVVSARVAATSFTILSSSGTDTSVVAWLIIEPN